MGIISIRGRKERIIVGDGRCPIRKLWHSLCSRSKKKNMECVEFKYFLKWFNEQKKECYYCGIKESELNEQNEYLEKSLRKKITIDRKDNNKGYVIGNIALACNSCNSYKSNRLTEQQMLDWSKKRKEKRLKNCKKYPSRHYKPLR